VVGPDALRWTGAAGALLLTGASWVMTSTGSATALAAGIAGMGLLVLAWATTGRYAEALTPGRARRTLALWCGPLLVAPPLFSRDVYSYLAQGLVPDPYAAGPAASLGAASAVVARVDSYWRDVPSPYGPVFTVIEHTIAQIAGGDPVVGVLLHRLVEVAGVVLVTWAVPRLAALSGASQGRISQGRISQGRALWLGVLNPLVAFHLVAGAHCDALMLGLTLAGVAVALREAATRPAVALGVGLVALGALVKATALVALLVVGLELARRRRLGVTLGTALGVLLAVPVATGTGFGWVRNLTAPTLLHSWMAPTNWPGYLAGGGDVIFAIGRITGLVLMVVGAAVVAHRSWLGRLDVVSALGVTYALVVLLAPAVQPWYLLAAVIPLAASPLATHSRVAVATACVTAAVAVAVPPLAGDFTGNALPLVVGYASAAVVAAAVYAVLMRDGTRREGMMRAWSMRRSA
jgi:alpha-1,6-mannosyltransferase